MKTHSISPEMAKTMHNVINSWKPETIAELSLTVSQWIKHQSVHHCALDFEIKRVFYYGTFQGVKVTLIDKQHRTRKQVTPKGKVYCIYQ